MGPPLEGAYGNFFGERNARHKEHSQLESDRQCYDGPTIRCSALGIASSLACLLFGLLRPHRDRAEKMAFVHVLDSNKLLFSSYSDLL